MSSQSIGVSTGVAMEFRKSRPSESAIKIAGGLCCTIGPPSKQAKEVSRITYQTAIDKLCFTRHNLSIAIELVMSRRSLDLRSSGMAIKDVSVVLGGARFR